jgi:hypothetical protein
MDMPPAPRASYQATGSAAGASGIRAPLARVDSNASAGTPAASLALLKARAGGGGGSGANSRSSSAGPSEKLPPTSNTAGAAAAPAQRGPSPSVAAAAGSASSSRVGLIGGGGGFSRSTAPPSDERAAWDGFEDDYERQAAARVRQKEADRDRSQRSLLRRADSDPRFAGPTGDVPANAAPAIPMRPALSRYNSSDRKSADRDSSARQEEPQRTPPRGHRTLSQARNAAAPTHGAPKPVTKAQAIATPRSPASYWDDEDDSGNDDGKSGGYSSGDYESKNNTPHRVYQRSPLSTADHGDDTISTSPLQREAPSRMFYPKQSTARRPDNEVTNPVAGIKQPLRRINTGEIDSPNQPASRGMVEEIQSATPSPAPPPARGGFFRRAKSTSAAQRSASDLRQLEQENEPARQERVSLVPTKYKSSPRGLVGLVNLGNTWYVRNYPTTSLNMPR